MAKIPNEHQLRVKLRLEGSDGLVRGTELDLGPVTAKSSATKKDGTIILSVDFMALKVDLARVLREAADDLELIRPEDIPSPLDV